MDTTCSWSRCYLMIGGTIMMEGIMDNMLYCLLLRVCPPDSCLYSADFGMSQLRDEWQPLQTWHYRLSYISHNAIWKMANSWLVNGFQVVSSDEDTFCEGCTKGKQYRNSFFVNNPRVRATTPSQLVHTDICGPMSMRSRGGAYYFAVFKDNYTCHRIVHCLTAKSDVQASI